MNPKKTEKPKVRPECEHCLHYRGILHGLCMCNVLGEKTLASTNTIRLHNFCDPTPAVI